MTGLVYSPLVALELAPMELDVAVVIGDVHPVVVLSSADVPTCCATAVGASMAHTTINATAWDRFGNGNEVGDVLENGLFWGFPMLGIAKGAVADLADHAGAAYPPRRPTPLRPKDTAQL